LSFFTKSSSKRISIKKEKAKEIFKIETPNHKKEKNPGNNFSNMPPLPFESHF
jgi:hypothetical protein